MKKNKTKFHSSLSTKKNLGVNEDGCSYVYTAKGSTPENNMRRVMQLMGGIESVIGKRDIVILKPNAQWDKQGMTNTDAMKEFIEMVLDIPDFEGEIIIAENHQYKELNGRGWITKNRNGRFNYNELIEYFNDNGYNNVTKYHWHCAGQNPEPLEGDDCCGKRVWSPEDGDGYVWREDIYYVAPNGRKCLMTYPIFTSEYSGVTIDLKNGAWENGKYLTDKPVKLINFSVLNHHSSYAGVTASVKNLMGIVDMTCGFQGPEPKDTYNVHFIGVSKYIRYAQKMHWRLTLLAMRNFFYAGGALGTFMKKIRMPDLNIITAEWVGWGSRWDTAKSCYPKTVLASRDPVALDYIAAKEVLLKGTPIEEVALRQLNDPSDISGPFYKFLFECYKEGIGNVNESKINTIN